MYVIAIGWMYVVLMMAIAEALSSQGTLLGAVFTVLLYGVLPLAIVLYILGTPARKRALRAREQEAAPDGQPASTSVPPDRGRHAPGTAVAAEREEP